MTVVFMEGFDHYANTQLLSYKGWNTNQMWSMQAGRFGGQAWYNGQGSANWHALPGSYTELIYGIAGKMIDFDPSNAFAVMNGASTVVAKVMPVTIGSDRFWKIVNSAGTTLATGTTKIATATWYYFELRVVVSATVGTVELRLNGSPTAECSATGVNTGSATINTILASGNQFYYDDIYCVDPNSGSSPTNTWLGDVRVETLMPTGDGNSTAWTGTYTAVDESVANDDTDYIYSATPGQVETYGLSNLSVSAGTVFAVQMNLTARKDDAGARTIAPVVRVGSTDYVGTTTTSLSSSYLGYRQLYDRLDPSGAGWTVPIVNAMEAGVKEVA
jgi:hypothetical protein